ncbi:MAG: FAD-binding oxidoreductase [Verrucomicrobiota bacterium]|nr:FAD-binding oxidoreductase [Verrucomicrobiota bacterium]
MNRPNTFPVAHQVAIAGAGVSGLTCAVVFAERGYRAAIFAEQMGPGTTSAAAGAIWYPYDAGPSDRTIAWALETYHTLLHFAGDPRSGVSMIEQRTFSRTGKIEIPEWALLLGARELTSEIPAAFASGFALNVPLTDTTIYLDYLARRFREAGGEVHLNKRFDRLEDVDPSFDLVINCTGIGAKTLAPDPELEPHRGQVALVSKIALPYAVVCNDPPLIYAIPRTNDCVLGGTNDLSDNLEPDPAATTRILAECSRVLGRELPPVLGEQVGLRPFRRLGVRVERAQLRDGRVVIHDYGHGGSGFTFSWGCAEAAASLAPNPTSAKSPGTN